MNALYFPRKRNSICKQGQKGQKSSKTSAKAPAGGSLQRLFTRENDASSLSSSTMVRPVLKALISQSSKTLKKNNSSSSKSFFTLCSASQPSIYYNPRIINNPFLLHQHHFNFRPHFLFPLSSTLGPLFFSSPPWKLSQSATPLLLCDVVSINLPKVRSALYLPYTLGLQSSRKLLKKEAEKHNSNDDNAREYIASKLTAAGTRSGGAVRVADSYLNIPNFISFTRLLSGPLLGWYIFYFSSPF